MPKAMKELAVIFVGCMLFWWINDLFCEFVMPFKELMNRWWGFSFTVTYVLSWIFTLVWFMVRIK